LTFFPKFLRHFPPWYFEVMGPYLKQQRPFLKKKVSRLHFRNN
jgi:hypothetical protein